LNIIFAGTPDFAATTLKDLISSNHKVVAVYTQPDRPSGRGRKLTPSPVKQLAIANNIEVFQPANLKEEVDQNIINTLNADIMIVVAYGVILPEAVLNTPRFGCLNIHASLLPKWRGAAPIQRAILAGDKESGVTIMQMDKGLDTGDMLTISRCPIDANDTGSSLHDKLARLGSKTLLQTLTDIENNQLVATAQNNELATYAHKLNKQEGKINWSDNATDIINKIQAFNSWPVAHCLYNKQPLRLWQAKIPDQEFLNKNVSSKAKPGTVIEEDKTGIFVTTGDSIIQITELQLPGKKRTEVKDFINSNSLKAIMLS
jgi:methionyl-tRNA formyltransferase